MLTYFQGYNLMYTNVHPDVSWACQSVHLDVSCMGTSKMHNTLTIFDLITASSWPFV